MNLLKIFTLAQPLGKEDTTIYVEQNPEGITRADRTRVLKIGTELISYENFTTEWPYKFTGCIRGIDQTTINEQPTGYMFGLLDVSEFGSRSVYIDQNTSLQDEIAEKLADLYSDQDNSITLPVSDRRFLKATKLTKDELILAFKNAKIVN